MGAPASASSVVTVPEQASATVAAFMASSLPSSPSITRAQPATRDVTISATVGAAGTTTRRFGWVSFRRRAASSNGGSMRAISPGRLPGRTIRIGSVGPTPIALRNLAGLALEKSTVRAELPTKVTGRPSASKYRASKAWIDSRWSTVAASVLARPGRVAQTCGPTYLISGRPGIWRRRR